MQTGLEPPLPKHLRVSPQREERLCSCVEGCTYTKAAQRHQSSLQSPLRGQPTTLSSPTLTINHSHGKYCHTN